MRTHNLKILPPFFNSVIEGQKTFEIRFNDRDFQVGDRVELNEFSKKDKQLTGRSVMAEVGFVFKGSEYGIKEGYCVFSLLNLSQEMGKTHKEEVANQHRVRPHRES